MATHLIVGAREPELAQLQPAQQRSQVEAVLGHRLWNAGVADGLTYDIYQFKAHQPMRPISGTFLLGLDFFTAGITEFNLADVKNFAPVKQLAVTYDTQDRVRHISAPWFVETAEPSRRLRSLVPPNAGIPTNAYPSPLTTGTGTNPMTAIVNFPIFTGLFNTLPAQLDGRKIQGHTATVTAGWHTIDYNTLSARVKLYPGRVYRLVEERYYPAMDTAVTIDWIEDVNSNETLCSTWPAVSTPCPTSVTGDKK
jgi:hypothetical protein